VGAADAGAACALLEIALDSLNCRRLATAAVTACNTRYINARCRICACTWVRQQRTEELYSRAPAQVPVIELVRRCLVPRARTWCTAARLKSGPVRGRTLFPLSLGLHTNCAHATLRLEHCMHCRGMERHNTATQALAPAPPAAAFAFSSSSLPSSPFWCICVAMSQPPTNSPAAAIRCARRR
jgi:hypothetical protein